VKKVLFLTTVIVLNLSVLFSTGFGQGICCPPLNGIHTHMSTHPQGVERADINAVVVKSWGGGGASAWLELNSEWHSYGSISISIDTTTLGNVPSFTYQDLVDTNADVIILSDPAGGVKKYSASEIAAVQQYALEGHNVIGTFLVLQWIECDNRGLAPIFGLRSDIDYITESISNTFNQLDPADFLFNYLPDPWTSMGYPHTQSPEDDYTWDPVDLNGAVMKAEGDSYEAMISVYNAGSYRGIYISNMPEHNGTANDKQLLYNAIVCDPAALSVSPNEVSAWLGGTFDFSLYGESQGNRNYALLGSTTGSTPGTVLPGGLVLCINSDWFTEMLLGMALNGGYGLVNHFIGNLNAEGFGTANLVFPGHCQLFTDLTLTFAWCTTNPFNFVSNPVDVTLLGAP